MPVNSVSETKKLVEKPRFSLSLRPRKDAICLSNENKKPNENIKENTILKPIVDNNKENKPLKRQSNTYLHTITAAKRLKPLGETSKTLGKCCVI